MKRKRLIVLLLACVILLCGCAPLGGIFGTDADDVLPLAAGTTTGNIINGGFAVQHGEIQLVYYTGQSVYDFGSIITSDPATGETKLLIEEGGLYLNITDDGLFYCREDGIYKTSMGTLETVRIYEGAASLLQVDGDALYFVTDGAIDSVDTDGQTRSFSPIADAAWLNVYGGALYYVDTRTGYICTAGMDGEDVQVVYETSVDTIIAQDDVIYFIDSADGFIKRILLSDMSLETVVEYPCSGFNVNRQGLYYTRDVEGQSLCCNVGADGYKENVIADLGQSAWHRVCMWSDIVIVVPTEDIDTFQ